LANRSSQRFRRARQTRRIAKLRDLSFQRSDSLLCGLHRRCPLLLNSSRISEGLFRHAADLMQELANLNFQV